MTDTDIPTQAEIANAIYCHAPYGPGNPCDVDCKCEIHFNAIVDLLSSRPTPSAEPPDTTDTEEPTQAEIEAFLAAFFALEKFEAVQRHVRGYGAFKAEDCPIPEVVKVVAWLKGRPAPSAEPRIDPDTVHRCAKVTDKQTQDLRDLISWYPGSSAALTWEIAAQHCEACSVTIRSFLTDGRPAQSTTAAIIERDKRQAVVVEWGTKCFGADHMSDKIVRAARFFEEAAELVQAIGLPKDHALRAFEHVYTRAPGEPAQEAGGVGVTLMALCNAIGLSADACEEKEIARCLSKSPETFAARNKAKLEHVDARPPQSSPSAGEVYWRKRLSLAKAEIERLRADQSSPPAGEGEIELCTYGPPRERKRYWILRFEDADVGDMHFTDETEAHAAFSRHEDAWTCTLFVTASNRPQSSPPAGEGEIEWALTQALDAIKVVHDRCLATADEIANKPGRPRRMPPAHYTDQAIGLSHALDIIWNLRPSHGGPSTLRRAHAPAAEGHSQRVWERTRVCVAAAIASNKFRQWVPQRWLELFMDAYEAAEPAPPAARDKS